MKLGNSAFELAELRTEQERDAGVALAQAALKRAGSSVCLTCSEPIDEQRRKALPSAERCLDCQLRIERFRKKRRG